MCAKPLAMIASSIAPALRAQGFRRYGQTFVREAESGLFQIIGFQGSVTGEYFFVSIGVSVREIQLELETDLPGSASGKKWPTQVLVATRVGEDSPDSFWGYDDLDNVTTHLLRRFSTDVADAFAMCSTRTGLIEWWTGTPRRSGPWEASLPHFVLLLKDAAKQEEARGSVIERVGRSFEQLEQSGDDNLGVRMAAIEALEQIALESPAFHWPVMEVLSAYLRKHAPVVYRSPSPEPSANCPARAPDHQAIATVIGRRQRSQDLDGGRLRLEQTDLSGVRWEEASLQSIDFYGALLMGADLHEAHLDGASLNLAHLEEANLIEAHLEGTYLMSAYLDGADLTRAELEGAHLDQAHLEGAKGLTREQLAVARSLAEAHLPAGMTS
jgi:Pentapeptide repeats (8 copies)/Domain of unknown function (DUF4304)